MKHHWQQGPDVTRVSYYLKGLQGALCTWSEAWGFPDVLVECLDHKNSTTELSRGYWNTRNIKSERLNPIQLLIEQFL